MSHPAPLNANHIDANHNPNPKAGQTITMKEFLLPIAIFAGWYALNAWILPKFGFST